jgi:hypothetical protein
MRIRLLGAVAALVGCAAFAAAQTAPPMPVPTLPPAPANPPGMTPLPVASPAALPPASLPAPPAAPPIMATNPNCGTSAVAAPCADCKAPKRAGGGLLGNLFIGRGTATPVGCGCFAAERTFLWGGCRQFFTPGRTCGGGSLDYGCGSGNCQQDNCRNVTSFLNR